MQKPDKKKEDRQKKGKVKNSKNFFRKRDTL